MADSLWPDIMDDESLSEHQRSKIRVATSKPVGILAGSPGTGKTHTAAALIKRLVEFEGEASIAIACPTGKAAVRMTSSIRKHGLRLEATTIHQLLEIGRNGRDGHGWEFQRSRDKPLDQRFLVIDEASMLDTSLAADLFEACADGTHVLLIGDVGQLPPVGHGAPLRDLIAASVPCGELEEIRRNAGMIVHACAEIKAGRRFETCEKYDAETGRNLKHVECADAAETVDWLRLILEQFRVSKKFDPVWETQVLVAVNTKSETSRVELNRVLQGLLNPDGGRTPPNPFRVGDKVICLRNTSLPLVSPDGNGPPSEYETKTELVQRTVTKEVHGAPNDYFGDCVYFIDFGEVVKIGRSCNVPRRKKELEKENSMTGQLILTIPNGELEMEIHEQFWRSKSKLWKSKGHREYFDKTNEVVEFINTRKSYPGPNKHYETERIYVYEKVSTWDKRGLEAYIANGEIGRVLAVGPKVTIAVFDGERTVKIVMGKPKEADADTANGNGETAGTGCDFALAYAITGHKSQGSEWPCVIVIADPAAGHVASREWIYTCISRASKLCVLLGKRATVDKQVRRVSLRRRKTFLKELIQVG